MKRRAIVYTDGRLAPAIWRYCAQALAAAAAIDGVEVVVVGPFGDGWMYFPATFCHQPGPAGTRRGLHDVHTKILDQATIAAGEGVGALYLCEHDVLYPPGYFSALRTVTPKVIYYQRNVWRANSRGYWCHAGNTLLSQCAGDPATIGRAAGEKLLEIIQTGKAKWSEYGLSKRHIIDLWKSPLPAVDLRHGHNLTGNRQARTETEYTDTLQPWGRHADLWRAIGLQPETFRN